MLSSVLRAGERCLTHPYGQDESRTGRGHRVYGSQPEATSYDALSDSTPAYAATAHISPALPSDSSTSNMSPAHPLTPPQPTNVPARPN
ncbi:unnamed protein product [Boreogadus saida]